MKRFLKSLVASLARFTNKHSSAAPARPLQARLGLEALEDRLVPSTTTLSPPFGMVGPVGTPVSIVHSADGKHVAEVVQNSPGYNVFKHDKTVGRIFGDVAQFPFSRTGDYLGSGGCIWTIGNVIHPLKNELKIFAQTFTNTRFEANSVLHSEKELIHALHRSFGNKISDGQLVEDFLRQLHVKQIDWKSQMLVVVPHGLRANSTFAITGLEVHHGTLKVHSRETVTNQVGTAVSQHIISGAEVALVQRFNGPVNFVPREQVTINPPLVIICGNDAALDQRFNGPFNFAPPEQVTINLPPDITG